jgi:predicted ATPase
MSIEKTKNLREKSNDLTRYIKLESIKFGTPSFRKLGTIEIKIASRMTLIAGRNGVGKSTILALISGGSGLTRGVKHKSYFQTLPSANAEEILKLSYDRDFEIVETRRPSVLLNYSYAGKVFQKKSNVSGTSERLRVVPRNEPKGACKIDNLVVPPDGKVPIPTLYLGMLRVLPVGEMDRSTLQSSKIEMHADDYEVYQAFTEKVIAAGLAGTEPNVIFQHLAGTKKRSVYPLYEGYDSTSMSLGQDSLSAIATALASFSKLKRQLGADYRGGILIIDEIDAGLHPHAQVQLLEGLMSNAKTLGLQVIATTHSLTMLEHAHRKIHNPKFLGTPLDGISYLKAGQPIELMDASLFDHIHADMHMKLRTTLPDKKIKLYVEDDEAALFLTRILTPARKKVLAAKTEFKLEIVSAKVGCSNLIGLIRADDYFKSVVIVLDADTTGESAGGFKNIVRLPRDPLNTEKQSPEVIIKGLCEKLCKDVTTYPKTRTRLKKLGADTSFLQTYILNLQAGETKPQKTVEKDREVAKKWFGTRSANIISYQLIEGWIEDNADEVDAFLSQLASAMLIAGNGADSPYSKRNASKVKAP